MLSRAAFFGLIGLASVLSLPASGSPSETNHAKVRRGSGSHPVKTAPDVTATMTKPTPPASAPVDEPVPPPYLLPTASRARVRACGATWRDMKLAGRTGDDDWRDFAVKCFTAKDAPATIR